MDPHLPGAVDPLFGRFRRSAEMGHRVQVDPLTSQGPRSRLAERSASRLNTGTELTLCGRPACQQNGLTALVSIFFLLVPIFESCLFLWGTVFFFIFTVFFYCSAQLLPRENHALRKRGDDPKTPSARWTASRDARRDATPAATFQGT